MLTKKNTFLLLLLFSLLFSACSQYTGKFAYKSVEMDHYERLADGAEFEKGDHAEWVFVPDSETSSLSAGVVTLQKKAVWIDIESRVAPVTELNPNIYGTLKTDEVGSFQLQIVVENEVTASVSYSVYEKEESDPFDE